jgi:hypothetical protein
MMDTVVCPKIPKMPNFSAQAQQFGIFQNKSLSGCPVYACNNLTTFDYEVLTMTGNGSYLYN